MSEPMNILFSIDQGFVPLCINCIRSLLTFADDTIHLYILQSSLSPHHKALIESALGGKGDCRFIHVPEEWFQDFPETDRYPKEIYYRIAVPLLLPEGIDRILYLDVDTVVIGPLKELYEMDFQEKFYIACTHTRAFLTGFNLARLDAPEGSPYINSGVMMMNLKLLRQNLRLEDVRGYTRQHIRSLLLPDQDIITGLYGDRILLADTMRYNLSDRILNIYNMSPGHKKLDLAWVRSNTSIIHYCGKNKPWKKHYHGMLGTFYWENQKACPVNR